MSAISSFAIQGIFIFFVLSITDTGKAAFRRLMFEKQPASRNHFRASLETWFPNHKDDMILSWAFDRYGQTRKIFFTIELSPMAPPPWPSPVNGEGMYLRG
ncbi:MAG: hypothetical protein COZ70_05175 [Deltaproteobacteria bacterium CG_4_8_14_3_um_filter_51_11]|nr:MAG: hypothetical protein AUK25_01930 [Desulfobacteraceae bacterium CG2_30_51_40]PIV99320.1 MAG: hypothetical protein COW41_08240 [Deltaproteobacteria bacterium CG17_big_fil_post_rev_8_21_14_2_50_51_6]PIX20165.1 MAG: hypothetical protein COZ70_05175 [Deltaproteobacteria bacterium CG_4_8_14_3_um_filter_51_11]PIY26540.1 MAG: hypothetical protein COZ11_02420 [Deltaproteobacteria bacterium CG_4_10_14_3_um_filter_51_14]